MFMPAVFHENLFDDLFDPFWNDGALERAMNREEREAFVKRGANMMKTDVRETESTYELDVDLPGFKKDEIKVDLKNGYLTIAAEKGIDKETENKKGRYIRRERYVGSNSRSFYVGDDVKPEDIGAKYEDGILKISLPKAEAKKLPSSGSISIE